MDRLGISVRVNQKNFLMDLIWWLEKSTESEKMPKFLAWITEDKEDKEGEGECWGIQCSLKVSDKIIYLRGGMASVRGGSTGFH